MDWGLQMTKGNYLKTFRSEIIQGASVLKLHFLGYIVKEGKLFRKFFYLLIFFENILNLRLWKFNK